MSILRALPRTARHMVVERLRASLPAALTILAGACAVAPERPASPLNEPSVVERPNIVLILADDLGWADLGVYGSAFHETPHLDRLASEGVRFTDAYAASPVCSPSRTALLTGRAPARVRQTDWIPGERDRPYQRLRQVTDFNHLPLEEITVAELLARAGYANAHLGKWHLGGVGHLPTDQGFHVNVAGDHRGQPPSYFHPYQRGDARIEGLPDGGEEGEYLTDRLTTEAVRFIGENRERPFFLYLPHFAVHTPLQAPEPLVAKYRSKANVLGVTDSVATTAGGLHVRTAQTDPVYAAMVESLDQGVGRVLAAIQENGLAERTIVVFTSDNGGLSVLPAERALGPTSNRPLRGGKGWLYEGGLRVPLIVRWPRAAAPATLSRALVTSEDLFPTLLEMAGVPLPRDRHVDGVSLVPVLRGRDGLRRDTAFWHYPHYHGSGARPAGAIRQGQWKLIEWFENGATELYDLGRDPGEREDLAPANAEKVGRLRAQLTAWRRSVGAQMPLANPEYTGDPKGPFESPPPAGGR